jgi:hypothetical protein
MLVLLHPVRQAAQFCLADLRIRDDASEDGVKALEISGCAVVELL